MGQRQYTLSRNQKSTDIVEAAGAAVGTDTIRLNLDITNMTRGEAVLGLEQLRERILEGPWPPA